MTSIPRRIFDEEKHVQFITFSCYKRRQLLAPLKAKRIVIGTLGSQLARHNGMCIGFVVMPNHVHALLWFSEANQLSVLMNHWKDQSSLRIGQLYRKDHAEYLSKFRDDTVWQSRYYPFNVYSERKLEEKLNYIHMNPVRAGLVSDPCDWEWSSARWYRHRQPVGIPIRMPEW